MKLLLGSLLLVALAAVLFTSLIGFSQDAAQYTRAVSALPSSSADEIGEIPLSPEFAALSINGKVVVNELTPECRAFLFRHWEGKGANFSGVLCLENEDESLFCQDAYNDKAIELCVPASGMGPLMSTANVDAKINKKLAPGIYKVSFTLD